MMKINIIEQKLNTEFSGENRKLVFWYDSAAEFSEDIDEINLSNAKLYKLEKDNQFYTKYFLECVDKETNYLIYAPFSKPDIRSNHLADTLLYSKEFFTDLSSLICVDLKIRDEYKPTVQKYIKFFKSKDRTDRFYKFEIEKYNIETIETALMSVICKCRTASFEEVVRAVILDDDFDDNKYMAEFDKYELTQSFWRLCGIHYGYKEETPALKKMVYTFFITYLQQDIKCELPKAWLPFVSSKPGTVIAFMSNAMNHVMCRDAYNRLSDKVAETVNAEKYLSGMNLADIIECDAFRCVDELIIKWMCGSLVSENIKAETAGKSMDTLCKERVKKHFGSDFALKYKMAESALGVLKSSGYICSATFENIVSRYTAEDFHIDMNYRNFYTALDSLDCSDEYEPLRELTENVYTNDWLGEIIPKWNSVLYKDKENPRVVNQTNFYAKYIAPAKEKVIVIISDALRFEVGCELYGKFINDPKCDTKIYPMLSVLPSYTKLGMAALLPHRNLTVTEDYKVLVDNKPCDSTEQRDAVMKAENPINKCIRYDDIKSLKIKEDLRKIFNGTDAVYIYHNQIDARGDNAGTENEVFNACSEAIDEIYTLVKRLSENTCGTRFIITADHGFIYKRNKLKESDKIDGLGQKDNFVNKRFIISHDMISADGTACYPMYQSVGNKADFFVTVPVGSDIFKAPGGGQYYTHGGSSPQEMLIPVIDVKFQKGHIDTTNAKIALVNVVDKVTGLILSLDFIQSDIVSDMVNAATYKLYFVADNNEKISNVCTYVADSKEKDGVKRLFNLRFNFKNQKYDKSKKYRLVVYDVNSEMDEPVWSHDVIMDLAFADDFGF